MVLELLMMNSILSMNSIQPKRLEEVVGSIHKEMLYLRDR